MFNRYELAAKSQAALQRLKNSQPIEESNQHSYTKPDYARIAFEEFDENSFDIKLKLDNYYYKTFLGKLPAEHLAETVQIISNMADTIHSIYEHINIKPKTYGFELSTGLNNSEEILESKAQKYINDYLRDNYYALTTEQREVKFLNRVKPIAEQVIIENSMEPEAALEYSTKIILINELLDRIAFPITIQSIINESLHDEAYAEIFEQDKLNELWETYKLQSYNFARLISLIV